MVLDLLDMSFTIIIAELRSFLAALKSESLLHLWPDHIAIRGEGITSVWVKVIRRDFVRMVNCLRKVL